MEAPVEGFDCHWNVYAQQLFRRGLGYPLWDPEPRVEEGEVLIGDVGYLDEGRFYRICNAMRDANDSTQICVPPGFKKLDLRSTPRAEATAVPEGPLFSQTVHRVMEKGTVGSHGANVAFQCVCTGQQGALAILGTPGKHEVMQQSREMVEHMKENIDIWHLGATLSGIGARDMVAIEDILFVRGWVKTSCWAAVAFAEDSRGEKLTFNGDLGLPAYAAFETQRGRRPTSEEALSNSVVDTEPVEDESDGNTDRSKPYDPVVFILDYILKNSEANVAIASDFDLIRLCKGRTDDEYPIPDDIPKFLEETKPPVNVTEDGLGTLFDEATEMHLATEG
ncbi:uncharacterized protein B0H18DRAFT_957451 [Fomitopsis serialis]|uniref:uncharacterized protein n=1 Tax=Fomitopsis serialis TaxID=139415 RepID=UPI002007D594|nr:uncharacterized protein B0H18DRAFT_957451 [Neoantrodia serialis]KAH9919630.1 hypothetical protein B0H18DRAFT_957451 [Neoantrodia serialis]